MRPARTMLGPALLHALFALWVTLCAAPIARAQSPAASAPISPHAAPDLRAGHIWLFDRFGRAEEGVLMHVPPRDQRITAVSARQACSLAEKPEALVAMGDQVFVLMQPRREAVTPSEPPRPGQPRVPVVTYVSRRVASISAERVAPGGWAYLPEGRTESHAPLLGGGTIMSAVALADGPLVLTVSPADQTWTIQWLNGRQWVQFQLPAPLASSPPPALCQLIELPGGVELLTGDSATPDLHVWTARLVEPEPTPGAKTPRAAPTLTWDPLPRAIINHTPSGDVIIPDLAALRVARIDGALVGWTQISGRLSIFRLSGLRAAGIGVVDSVPSAAAVVPVHGLSRLAIIAHADNTPTATETTARDPDYLVREISTIDGTELFTGRARKEGLLAARDIWLVGMALAMILAVVLLFVLRREANPSAAAVVLPEGSALASPFKRLVAACLDNLIALYIATLVSGVPLNSVVGGTTYVDPQQVLELTGCAALIGLLISTLTEWFMGRTPGKLLVGIAVVGLSHVREDQPASTPGDPGAVVGSTRIGWPNLRQALLRNIVKWGFPPLTVLLLFDSSFRHLGDTLSRTVVIEPLPPPEHNPPD